MVWNSKKKLKEDLLLRITECELLIFGGVVILLYSMALRIAAGQ